MSRTSERHAAIYLRVSSKTQDTRSQEPDLRRWAEGQELPARWYRDTFTGTTMDRPGWGKLWAELLAGGVACVVVWRLDRLGRTTLGLVELFEQLRERRVDLVSLRDGIAGLDSAAGRLTATILAGVSQYEREVRSERQRAGIAAAQAAGKTFGRPKGTGRPLKVSEDRARLVEQLLAEGRKISDIAYLTNLSRSTVYTLRSARPAPAPADTTA